MPYVPLHQTAALKMGPRTTEIAQYYPPLLKKLFHDLLFSDLNFFQTFTILSLTYTKACVVFLIFLHELI